MLTDKLIIWYFYESQIIFLQQWCNELGIIHILFFLLIWMFESAYVYFN